MALDPNGSYPASIWSPTVDTSGFSVDVGVTCLKPSDVDMHDLTADNFGTCSASSTGLQQITVTVTSSGGKGESEAVTILKRTS